MAVSDSPIDEKTIPLPRNNATPANAKAIAQQTLDASPSQPDASFAERPSVNRSTSDTPTAGGVHAGDASIGAGGTGVRKLSDVPAAEMPNVLAEAAEYYGGKEVWSRSRTYSIVSCIYDFRSHAIGI